MNPAKIVIGTGILCSLFVWLLRVFVLKGSTSLRRAAYQYNGDLRLCVRVQYNNAKELVTKGETSMLDILGEYEGATIRF